MANDNDGVDGGEAPEKRARERMTIDCSPDLMGLYDRAAEAEGFSSRAEWVRVTLLRAARLVVPDAVSAPAESTR